MSKDCETLYENMIMSNEDKDGDRLHTNNDDYKNGNILSNGSFIVRAFDIHLKLCGFVLEFYDNHTRVYNFVTMGYVPVSGLIVDPSSLLMTRINQSVEVDVQPSNATNKVVSYENRNIEIITLVEKLMDFTIIAKDNGDPSVPTLIVGLFVNNYII